MPATAEKGGLERLVERGVISEVCCQVLEEEVITGSSLGPIVAALDSIANELCNLLEERDRREGIADNPPEIPDVEYTRFDPEESIHFDMDTLKNHARGGDRYR